MAKIDHLFMTNRLNTIPFGTAPYKRKSPGEVALCIDTAVYAPITFEEIVIVMINLVIV